MPINMPKAIRRPPSQSPEKNRKSFRDGWAVRTALLLQRTFVREPRTVSISNIKDWTPLASTSAGTYAHGHTPTNTIRVTEYKKHNFLKILSDTLPKPAIAPKGWRIELTPYNKDFPYFGGCSIVF